jgi:hypothetical protein
MIGHCAAAEIHAGRLTICRYLLLSGVAVFPYTRRKSRYPEASGAHSRQDDRLSIHKKTLSQRLGLAIARAIGWQVRVEQSPPAKCVIIGAHHTSSWDLLMTLILMWGAKLRFRWLAKDTLFRWPLGALMRSLGGMPIDRRVKGDFVQYAVDAFRASDELMIAIAPEGTRREVAHWKTGFYYIAVGACVPIVMGYADYKRRIVGLGPVLIPSGDVQADFEVIRSFYANVAGRYPSRQGEVAVQPSRATL